MSIRWIDAAMQHSQAHGNARLVLIVLANNADDETGSCYPGIKYIAHRAGIDERTVRRMLRQLEELGEISTRINASHIGTNLYTINPSILSGVSDCPGGADCPGGGGRLTPKPSVEPSEHIHNAREPKKASLIPEDWEPNEKGRQFALDRDIGIDAEVDKFIDHHRQRGNKYLDWNAAWRTWCRNHRTWADEKRGTDHVPGTDRSQGWAYPTFDVFVTDDA